MEDLPMEEVKYLCFPKKLKFELLVKIIFIKMLTLKKKKTLVKPKLLIILAVSVI